MQYHDGRRYAVGGNEGSHAGPYNPKRNVCPKFPTRPSCSSYLQSTCWAPGAPDLDCPNHGLCCFNGCSNVCIPQNKPPIRKGSRPLRRPAKPAKPTKPTKPSNPAGHFFGDAAATQSTKPHLSYNQIFNIYQGQASVISPTRKPPSTPPGDEYEYIEPSQAQAPSADPALDDQNKCPLIDPKPPGSCLDKKANCWSAGVPDLDCPNSGLCCFDGCVNTCVDEVIDQGEESLDDPFDETINSLATPDQEDEPYPNFIQDAPSSSYSDNPYKCPSIPLKPPGSCVNKKANCWSGGVPDVDCPDYGLCCFDGCVNTCVDQVDDTISQSDSLSDPGQEEEDTIPDFIDAPSYSDTHNTCPAIPAMPPGVCGNKIANCWSPGVPDVDCPRYGLCCFDGCVNTCIDQVDDTASLSEAVTDDDKADDTAPDFELDLSSPSSSDNPYECPSITPKPPGLCVDKKANCWSAGVLDLDCPNYGLCCFDGCVNTCVDEVNKTASTNDEFQEEILSDPAEDTPNHSDKLTVADDIIINHSTPTHQDSDKCPFITPRQNGECENKKANCWSVGVPDLDCPNYGLCCYDGCVNSCIDIPSETIPQQSQDISSPDHDQDTSLHGDNHQDHLDQPAQTYLDPPQEPPSYKCSYVPPKPASSCLHKKANCWSAGVLDLDCPNSGLCCFDGCVNTCVDMEDEFYSESSPDVFDENLTDNVQDEPHEETLDNLTEDDEPEEIDYYTPDIDSYGSPTADPVKLEEVKIDQSTPTEITEEDNDMNKTPDPTQNEAEDTFSGPFQDTDATKDKPTHGAAIHTINNLQITHITENKPSDAANSDEFVFPLTSSADPIQNTIMLLLDTYGPPVTHPAKPVQFTPKGSSYNPSIDSYGSPTADPVKLNTGVPSYFSSTESVEENNAIENYRPTISSPTNLVESASTVSVIGPVKDSQNDLYKERVKLTKPSFVKSPAKPQKQKVSLNFHQQPEFMHTSGVNYGSKLSYAKLQNSRKPKPKLPVNYANIDGYGSPLADPIRNVEKLGGTRKNAYAKPIQNGPRLAIKPNNKFSPIFYESVRLTTPRANIYRSKDKYVKKILKKKFVKSGSNKQHNKKPSEQKSSLGKFWERHFGFFPILEQPTPKPTTARPSSCPEVQSRSPEECKLNYQNYCTKLGQRDHLCPYEDICCYDGCANRCLNWKQPKNVFFRDSVGVFVQ